MHEDSVVKLCLYKIAYLIPDKLFLTLKFWKNFGYFLNWKHPQTFNEKLNWLKLNDHNPIYPIMVDKYEAKKYVSNIIGEEYVIPTYGVWNDANDINFDSLPDGFVMKATHDSGRIFVCRDKHDIDIDSVVCEMNKSLKRDFYSITREWPYKKVPRRIIAEKNINIYEGDDAEASDLKDYKFFCFNGKVKCFKIDYNRFVEHHANYYTPEGTLMKFGETVCMPQYDHVEEIPSNLAEMIELSEKLSSGFPFLRVDLYNVRGKIYFGELTLYPNSGVSKFTDSKWDVLLGTWMDIGV